MKSYYSKYNQGRIKVGNSFYPSAPLVNLKLRSCCRQIYTSYEGLRCEVMTLHGASQTLKISFSKALIRILYLDQNHEFLNLKIQIFIFVYIRVHVTEARLDVRRWGDGTEHRHPGLHHTGSRRFHSSGDPTLQRVSKASPTKYQMHLAETTSTSMKSSKTKKNWMCYQKKHGLFFLG